MTARREVFNGVHYPVRLVPNLTSARANPNSNKHWLYCKHICLWLIPCNTINELFPESSLEGKELQDYWIDKFNAEVVGKSLLPKWVQRQCRKYTGGDSSSEEEEDESHSETIFNEQIIKEMNK